jgi:hypothetical protein
MGLNLMVGYLAEAEEEDPETATDVQMQYSIVSECVAAATGAVFNEPLHLPRESRFSCEMFGYAGLHHLRRLAAYKALDVALYAPSSECPNDDPVVRRYYQLVGNGDVSDLPFQHLMLHGDAEGCYVPVEFVRVIDPQENFALVGGGIGSSHRLLSECTLLAATIELPTSLDAEAQEVFEAADSPGEGAMKWQRFGIESFSCLRLMRGAQASIEAGAALVFC